MSTKPQAKPSLSRELAGVWRAFKAPFEGYRPERHYMRGPGPKWRKKHAPAVTADIAALPQAA